MKEKVCHISTAHPPFDVRIFHKECVFLAEAGFDVSLVVTHDKKETVEGVKIIPLPKSKGRLHRMFVKTHFAFYRSLKTKSKIFHFHDPELIGLGILLKILGKKVIYDSHENVSSQIESKNWLGNSLSRNIVKSGFRIVEKLGIWLFDSVISVTPEIVQFLSPKKGVLIRNYPITKLISEARIQQHKSDKPILIYVGGLTRIRGIKELCEAVKIAKNKTELWLVGQWESTEFQTECMEGNEHIKYWGIKPLAEVYPLIKKADIGFVTLYPEKNYLNSLPIKAFEYMACSKPMIMSDIPYWENTFSGSALFVNPKLPVEIAKKIDELIDDENLAHKLGKKGKVEVDTNYSWEFESQKLVNLYQSILK